MKELRINTLCSLDDSLNYDHLLFERRILVSIYVDGYKEQYHVVKGTEEYLWPHYDYVYIDDMLVQAPNMPNHMYTTSEIVGGYSHV